MGGKKLFICVAVVSLLTIVSCGGGGDKNQAKASAAGAATRPVVQVAFEADFKVTADPATVPAGTVKFTAKNNDDQEHELVVLRTDLAADKLPFDKATGKVNEDVAGIENLGEIEDIEHGKSGELTLDLTAGKYVLVCNIAEKEADGKIESHYGEGMHFAFTVT
jgi:uncharacterized cupredoxin-like copper-binding protein